MDKLMVTRIKVEGGDIMTSFQYYLLAIVKTWWIWIPLILIMALTYKIESEV